MERVCQVSREDKDFTTFDLRDTDASQYHNFWDTIAERSFQITKSFVELVLG